MTLRCPWSGVICGCGPDPSKELGVAWFRDPDGLMPIRCENNTPLPMVSIYKRDVRPAKIDEYNRWVKTGQERE